MPPSVAGEPEPHRRCSSSGRPGLAAVAGLALALSACTPDLPASVVEGSTVRVGWSGDVTSLNAATRDGATPGNREIAAMTRDQFARVADGAVVVDESFGTVEVIDPDAASFTVRYDLADRRWSDGIPVDAADLLLAWAAGSKAFDGAEFESVPTDLRHSDKVPDVDEFERRIDVAYTGPVRGWQTALDVAVPAHVAGRLALDIEDPMEAKQAVITAIRDGDTDDLTAIAEAWNTGFGLDEVDADGPFELLVSSGPYRVEEVRPGESGGDLVRLAVNREYDGRPVPAYEHVELTPAPALDQLAEVGHDLDVAQFLPTAENRELTRELERRDHQVSISHRGGLWALVLRVDRAEFTAREARLAFLRTVPRGDLRAGGAGSWQEAYASSGSLLFSPESDGYTVALQDAGLREAFEEGATDPAFERKRAGVPAGTSVCVLHDTGEAFAVGAFAALRSAVAEAEAGWRVRDCGTKNMARAVRKNDDWHAVLTTIPLPESPRDIAAEWGSAGSSPSASVSKERDLLIEKLASTADPYDARDLRVAIEAHLISEAVVLPLAVDPTVTVASRSIENVRVDSGRSATLMAGVRDWEPSGSE
jgi:peptide/nickel transport system substrate-binding protein